MNYLLALLPILIVVGLMLILRWSTQRAGPVGWLAGLAVAALAFGLTWDVLWVSQLKGLLLSLNVLLILWTALFLYNLVDRFGGIRAIAESLSGAIPDLDWLQVVLAWALTAVVEGLAGFGLPMAIVAPMLVAMGVPAIPAVAATAIGHAWAVSFGNMGVVLQTLTAVVEVEQEAIVPVAGVLLALACVATGLAAALVLGKLRYWKRIVLIGALMGAVQMAAALAGLVPLGSFFASVAGIAASIGLWGRRKSPGAAPARPPADQARLRRGLQGALIAYGLLVALMMLTTLFPALRAPLSQVVWKASFPAVATTLGVETAAGPGQVFRPLVHPGSLILLSAALATPVLRRRGLGSPDMWSLALGATLRSAGPASLGVIAMVGLSTMMEHSGMTMLLAQGLAGVTGGAFPVVSPIIGILGAFATGSNSNSNVLFGPMQENVAHALGIAPQVLVSGQTAGGSLGSMMAPAKLVVGCSTTGLEGKDGLVLRETLPIGLSIGLLLGAVVWLLAR